jgi:hypothetical protein
MEGTVTTGRTETSESKSVVFGQSTVPLTYLWLKSFSFKFLNRHSFFYSFFSFYSFLSFFLFSFSFSFLSSSFLFLVLLLFLLLLLRLLLLQIKFIRIMITYTFFIFFESKLFFSRVAIFLSSVFFFFFLEKYIKKRESFVSPIY